MGHNYVGTEHILLALLELEDGSGILRRRRQGQRRSQHHRRRRHHHHHRCRPRADVTLWNVALTPAGGVASDR
jgi:UDP-N-acetylmuramyl pentapeptide phosphotransferase/UDP-N-acetylglucosamine-1-phosphate transferase